MELESTQTTVRTECVSILFDAAGGEWIVQILLRYE